MGDSEMKLLTQKNFDEFSGQLLMANIELPENLVVHWSQKENDDFVKNLSSENMKINTIQTRFHKFKIQVD